MCFDTVEPARSLPPQHLVGDAGPDECECNSGGAALPPCLSRYLHAVTISLASSIATCRFTCGLMTTLRLFTDSAFGGIEYAASTQPFSRTLFDTWNSLNRLSLLSSVTATTGMRWDSFIIVK